MQRPHHSENYENDIHTDCYLFRVDIELAWTGFPLACRVESGRIEAGDSCPGLSP
jgi:hypothetical protein